jgi:cytochrome P450
MGNDHDERPDIATPPAEPRGITLLFSLRTLPLLAARAGALLARLWGRPFRLGGLVIAARHRDVCEILSRDLDFIVKPAYAPRFDEIGYHFILGMDRAEELVRERRALYAALSKVDFAPIQSATARDIENRLARADGDIDVVEDYARPVAAATARALFGIAAADQALFMDAARAIFGHCFLNQAGDKVVADRAKTAAGLLTDWFDAEIARRAASGDLGEDVMGHLLRDGASADLARRSLGGMLVGSIDTTATVVAKVMTVLMDDRALLEAARRDRADLARLHGWCQEALRRWTQTPILGRVSASDTTLAGVNVPAGARVILWTQAAMFDDSAFPDPGAPRRDRPPDAYLHLGGGLHPCAGRGVHAWQLPMLVGGLLERPPARLEPMRWAGPFPAQLRLHWREATA